MSKDCVEYQGRLNEDGYGGDCRHGGRRFSSAHRRAFYIANGYVPTLVMHTCDNRACINPAHLAAGTQKQNVRDSMAKGRHSCLAIRKLSDSAVMRVRGSTASNRTLAAELGCSHETIRKARNGERYQHVGG